MNRPIIPILLLVLMCPLFIGNDALAQTGLMDEIRKREGMEKYLPKSSLDKLNQNRTFNLEPEAFNELERPPDINVDQYGNDGRGGYKPASPSRSQRMDGRCPGGGIPVLGQCSGALTDELRGHPDYQPGGRYDPNTYYLDPSLQPGRR